MEVSTFELLFKPQSPAAPAGVAAVDRVIQGYFLAISNLEPRELRYRLELIVPPLPPGTPNAAFRTPAGNALVFVDSGGGDNVQGVLDGAATQERFVPSTGLIRIPAHGTALVAVLPSAFGPLPGESTPLTTPNFETRGYVRLTLPALKRGIRGRVAQSANPVDVLLTPQHRATFFKADNTISDQVQATLPLAGGSARVSLPPEPGSFVLRPFDVDRERPSITTLLDSLDPEDRAPLLAALLADVNAEEADLEAFNRLLGQTEIPFSVVPRRP